MKYEANENNITKYHNGVFEVKDIKTGNEFLYKPLLSLDKSFVPYDFDIIMVEFQKIAFLNYMLMGFELDGYFLYSLWNLRNMIMCRMSFI